jgi:hypothetical protein
MRASTFRWEVMGIDDRYRRLKIFPQPLASA